jgi:glutathione peroxidase
MFKGQVLLLVNVASKCGLTPQYADLELFYRDQQAKGVTVLGFPANNFGAQEPGTNQEIKAFCTTQYEVSFPMFGKISVKGADIHPLYQYLTQTTGQPVAWNFQKFLVDKHGNVVRSFEPTVTVNSPELQQAVQALL